MGRTRERLRGVDLARSVGLSVQAVRNYVELGVLPPVERTASGYRIFTSEHAAALVVVRRMVEGHGWERTRTIMHAVHDDDMPAVLTGLDESHAELARERADIAEVLAAVAAIAPLTTSPATSRGNDLRIGEVARVARVRTPVLRLWERRGLLRPRRERGTGYRLYDDAELRTAQVVALLRRGAYPFPVIGAVVEELRTARRPERVRAELAARERDLSARSMARLRASAALHGYLEQRLRD